MYIRTYVCISKKLFRFLHILRTVRIMITKHVRLCALVLEVIQEWKTGDVPAVTADAALLKYSALIARIFELKLEEAYAFNTILGTWMMNARARRPFSVISCEEMAG